MSSEKMKKIPPSMEKIFITLKTTVNASIEKVWECWTDPEHIKKWNAASDDWHTPSAENDLRSGGKFNYSMEAKNTPRRSFY